MIASAVGVLSGGAHLTAYLGYLGPLGRGMVRCEGADNTAAAGFGEAWLASNPGGAEIAVLLYEGLFRASEAEARQEAIVAHAVDYQDPRSEFRIALRFRPHQAMDGFGLHGPTFSWDRVNGADPDKLTQAFLRGVEKDREGAWIWARTLINPLAPTAQAPLPPQGPREDEAN